MGVSGNTLHEHQLRDCKLWTLFPYIQRLSYNPRAHRDSHTLSDAQVVLLGNLDEGEESSLCSIWGWGYRSVSSPNVAEASVCHHKPSHHLDEPVLCLVLQFDALTKPECSLSTRGTDLTQEVKRPTVGLSPVSLQRETISILLLLSVNFTPHMTSLSSRWSAIQDPHRGLRVFNGTITITSNKSMAINTIYCNKSYLEHELFLECSM